MILQFACAKAGLLLYTLDPVQSSSTEAFAQALTLSQANIVIIPEAYNDINYIRLAEQVVVETRFFDFSTGSPFVSPSFPHVRLPVHTGFDQYQQWGWIPYRQLLVPSNNLSNYISGSSASTVSGGEIPLCGQFVYDETKMNGSSIPIDITAPLTHSQIMQQPPPVIDSLGWSTYQKVLNKSFHVVDGVGVIF
jgi:hypothetical protein